MRESCLYCTLGHLAEALDICLELDHHGDGTEGKGVHAVYLLGALKNAESQCRKEYPEIADSIRVCKNQVLYGLQNTRVMVRELDLESVCETVYNQILTEEDASKSGGVVNEPA